MLVHQSLQGQGDVALPFRVTSCSAGPRSYEEEKKVSEQNLRAIDPLRRLMHL